jgi:hypothetical protein
MKHLNEVADKMKEKVTSEKKNTVITLSDEVTELSSIKCTVDNWNVILDTCVQHGSEQQCLVEMDRITRKNSDLNEIKEAIFKPRKSLVTFEPNKFLCEFQTNVESFGDLTLDSFPEVNFLSGSIKILNTIEINTNTTSKERQITGIFVQNFIIFADSINRQVIKYNENYVYLSSLSFGAGNSIVTFCTHITVLTERTNKPSICMVFAISKSPRARQPCYHTAVCNNKFIIYAL